MNQWFQYIVDNEAEIAVTTDKLTGDTARLLDNTRAAGLRLAALRLALGAALRQTMTA